MQRILVLRGGALGDFLVTLPALALLRGRWPAARIELAGNATAARLGQNGGLLDAVHSQGEARWSTLFRDAALPVEFAAWLAGFDLVVNYWPDPGGELRAHFPRHDRQTFLRAESQPARAPAAAHYCAALRPLGLEPADYFHPLAGNRPDAPRSAKRLVALHPGSGSPRKNWPLDRWAALADWLVRECGAEVLVVAGEAESATVGQLARFGSLLANLPLPALAARLAECRLFIGHDSGVSHLAAACGVPSVLLFGPTEPAMWAPPAAHVSVLRRGVALASISPDDVQRAVTAALTDRT